MVSASEKIKILLKRQKSTVSELALKLETSQANLSHKFRRNNLSEKEISDIAAALDYDFEIVFTNRKTGEKL